MITLEPLVPEHFALVAEWLSEPEVNRWLSSEWRGQAVSSRIIAVVLRNKRNRLLLVRDDGDPCGLVGFSEIDEVDRFAMIWYLLGKRQSGRKGIITRAVGEALRVAFAEYELSCVYAWTIDGNDASRRVLEKNGFREAGRIRSAASLGAEQVDRIYFDITSDDMRPSARPDIGSDSGTGRSS